MAETLYDQCVNAGIALDHHESDLYIKDCLAARILLSAGGHHFETFRSATDGSVWLDVPFAYQPFWDAKTKVG